MSNLFVKAQKLRCEYDDEILELVREWVYELGKRNKQKPFNISELKPLFIELKIDASQIPIFIERLKNSGDIYKPIKGKILVIR